MESKDSDQTRLVAVIGDEVRASAPCLPHMALCAPGFGITLTHVPPPAHTCYSQDTVTGFLLAGVGQRTVKGNNYVVVDSSASRPGATCGVVNWPHRAADCARHAVCLLHARHRCARDRGSFHQVHRALRHRNRAHQPARACHAVAPHTALSGRTSRGAEADTPRALTLQVANEIRPLLSAYKKVLPVVVEIPSKDAPCVVWHRGGGGRGRRLGSVLTTLRAMPPQV